jgi:hypothetical protein
MELSPSAHPPLARAYLALADDPDAAAGQRTLPRMLVALAAAIALAFAAPLAWASAARGEPLDPPAATVVKAGDAEEDDGDDGDAS